MADSTSTPPLPVMTLPAAANVAPVDLASLFDGPIATQSKTERMDSQLAAMVAVYQSGLSPESLPSSPALRIEQANVHVQIAVDPGNQPTVAAVVAEMGGTITGESLDASWLQGWVPLWNLADLAGHPAIHYLRHPTPLTTLGDWEEVVSSEALSAFNVSDWRQSGRTGEGVRIAVIDGGFSGYRSLLGRELPPVVKTVNFVDGEPINAVEGKTNHGTAIAEIIYDIAPDAELYLARINTNIDLKEAVYWLIAHEVDMISTSIGWYNLTPGDGSGEFADLVAMAREAGILWVTAAGNDRENHWGGLFQDDDDDHILNFSSTQEINYFGPAPGEIYIIPAGYPISVYMRWSDWEHVDQDYDLHLVRWNGEEWEVVESSRNQQNGQPGQTPTEAIRFITYGAPAPYGILVERYRGRADQPPNLEIFIPKFYTPTQIIHARSLTNLADAPLALTVAAVDRVGPYLAERYSSEGPTNGPGGTAEGGLDKPEIAAYTNVTTFSAGGRFNGTSAATPHVVGAAALIKDAFPAWTPAQIQEYLLANAIALDEDGINARTGHGRLNLGPAPAFMVASTLHMDFASDAKATGSITFTLDLVNSSQIETEISLENPLPTSVEIVGAPLSSADPQPSLADRQLTWQGLIPANETVTITYVVQPISADSGQPLRILNRATITEANGTQTQLRIFLNPLELFLPLLQRGE
jgi:subtilisin family serine protease